MAHLYVNSRGIEITRHSYSAGKTFNECNKLYQLGRIQGWKERGNRAAFLFGQAVESGIRYHHENNLEGGADEFTRLWEKVKDQTLDYTATEGSWADLALSGREMLKLYALRTPYRGALKFQTEWRKEVFPGTKLAGIEFLAYIDVIATLPSGDKQICDIKTSGGPFKGIPKLNSQLRSYAWMTGIPGVALWWLTKVGRGLEKGSRVTVLEGEHAGKDAIVAHVYKGDESAFAAEMIIVLPDEAAMEAMALAIGDSPNSKLGKMNKANFLARVGWELPKTAITKQKLAFYEDVISAEQMQEAANKIGKEIAQIVHANETNSWEAKMDSGQFNSTCDRCAMRGICADKPALRDELVFRTDEEWDIQEET